MKEISVFYDNSPYTLRWLRALVWSKNEFVDKGYRVIFNGPSSFIPRYDKMVPPPSSKKDFLKLFRKEYDIVFLAYHPIGHPGLCALSIEDRAEVLECLKSRCNKIIWLDTADSTGTCFFDVLPYVDLYLKKQKLVDINRYCYPIYNGKIWCDYYHRKCQINDENANQVDYPVLDVSYANKIGISWNVGVGDLFNQTHVSKLVYRQSYAPVKFKEPSLNRFFDIHYRGQLSDSLVMYQRRKTVEKLLQTKRIVIPDVLGKVPYADYVKEMKNAKAIVSPFGFGEICGRDMEAFVYGCALLKMDMSHLETFPNWYIRDETYISIDWDFNNFGDMIDYLTTNEGKERLLYIAYAGQKKYKDYLTTKQGKMDFVEHIISCLKAM